jgi:sterol desaturase/sphingolipid hydroxylase (fatty acid hydroxylase superfamily)
MHDVKIRKSKDPIRLFESNVLEFFTHIHPAVVVAIWLPVSIIFFIRAFRLRPPGTSPLYILPATILGLLIWTLAEYVLHRFVFHFTPRAAWQERLAFLFHGVHHAQPKVKSRLVMPPAVSLPLAALFYGLFYGVAEGLLGEGYWVAPVFGSFILGYLIYDMTHYATHHVSVPGSYFKMVRRHHMRHHAKTPNLRFGVSSPLWDYIFGTEPKETS